MSAATESQRSELRTIVGDLARDCASTVHDLTGRKVKIVTIIVDTPDENIYSGVYEMGRDELIAVLGGMLEAIESNNHATRVTIDGEVVLDRGKSS